MKVYKDINEVIKPTEIPKSLWEYEKEMRKKPNFEHIKESKKKKHKRY